MQVRDVMTWNVVTVPSDTPVMEARKIMEAHKIRRLPIVDKGKLVGIVTKDRIARTGPPPATSLSVWELNYLMAKMTVKEVMLKDVVTVPPEMSVEGAVALAQSKGVGTLPVLEDHNLVGIVTTNDFFYRVLNPVLGIGEPGVRMIIAECGAARAVQDVMGSIEKHGMKIVTMHSMPALEGKEPDLCVHLADDDISQIVDDLSGKGYRIEIVER